MTPLVSGGQSRPSSSLYRDAKLLGLCVVGIALVCAVAWVMS